MWENLATAMPGARELAKEYPETVTHKDPGVPLRSRRGRLAFKRLKRNSFDSPKGFALWWFTASTLISHWFHTPRPENVAMPEVEFGKGDANWWRVPRYDSALVSSADGSGKNVYTRNRALFRRMLIESVLLHGRVRKEWPALQRRYQRAMPELTSPKSWKRHLELD